MLFMRSLLGTGARGVLASVPRPQLWLKQLGAERAPGACENDVRICGWQIGAESDRLLARHVLSKLFSKLFCKLFHEADATALQETTQQE